jgi:3-oxoacyl-[acyl-carrier protein] reductase
MNLKNKTILVTGASGGIGHAIAKILLPEKSDLYLHVNKQADLKSLKGKYTLLRADFRDIKQIEKLFKDLPPLDVVINAVGIEKTSDNPLDLKIWKEIFEINLFPAVKIADEAIKKMPNGGVLINIASIVGQQGITFISDSIAYPASKAALIKLNEGITAMYGSKVRAITISPGYVNTPMWDRFDQKIIDSALSEVPRGEFIKPEEVAQLILEVIKNESISGVNLTIDGGLGLRKLH